MLPFFNPFKVAPTSIPTFKSIKDFATECRPHLNRLEVYRWSPKKLILKSLLLIPVFAVIFALAFVSITKSAAPLTLEVITAMAMLFWLLLVAIIFIIPCKITYLCCKAMRDEDRLERLIYPGQSLHQNKFLISLSWWGLKESFITAIFPSLLIFAGSLLIASTEFLSAPSSPHLEHHLTYLLFTPLMLLLEIPMLCLLLLIPSQCLTLVLLRRDLHRELKLWGRCLGAVIPSLLVMASWPWFIEIMRLNDDQSLLFCLVIDLVGGACLYSWWSLIDYCLKTPKRSLTRAQALCKGYY